MTVPDPPSRFRLRFAALPVSLTLEAVPDRLAQRLARRWLAELGPAADETPSYTLRFRTDARFPGRAGERRVQLFLRGQLSSPSCSMVSVGSPSSS